MTLIKNFAQVIKVTRDGFFHHISLTKIRNQIVLNLEYDILLLNSDLHYEFIILKC